MRSFSSLALALALLVPATGCRFELPRTLGPGELRGTVVFRNAEGREVAAPGAVAELEGTHLRARADKDGRFVVRGLATGTYGLRVTVASSAGAGSLLLRGIDMTEGAGGRASGKDLGTLVAGAYGTLEGKVLCDATPVGGAQLAVAGVAQTASRTDEGHVGEFSLTNLPPGRYSLDVLGACGEGSAALHKDVTVKPAQKTDPELKLQGLPVTAGSVQGWVLLSDGGNPKQITVRLSGPSESSTDTDDEGMFLFNPVAPPGVYRVSVEDPDHFPVTIEHVLVAGETVTLPAMILTPKTANCGIPGERDSDTDGLGDACDVCPDVPNPEQETDYHGRPLACAQPFIEHVSPEEEQSGSWISLSGSGLTYGDAVVTVAGVRVERTLVRSMEYQGEGSSSWLLALLPPGLPAGEADVLVTTRYGTGLYEGYPGHEQPQRFKVVAPPTAPVVESAWINTSPAMAGDTVSLWGRGFGSGVDGPCPTRVLFKSADNADLEAPGLDLSSGFSAVVPFGAAGGVDVQNCIGRTSKALSAALAPLTAPSGLQASPDPARPGQIVTVTGSTLGARLAQLWLDNDQVPLEFVYQYGQIQSPGQTDVRFKVPAGTTSGSHAVKVVNPAGEATVVLTVAAP